MSAQDDLKRAAAAMPKLLLTRGDAVPIEPVRWLWRGFLPTGLLTILGGAPGCGKTTIALSLAATVTRGGSWPDGTCCTKAGDVVIWSGEDPQTVLAARLRAAGADMQRVHFIAGVDGGDDDERSFDPASDMPLLDAAASKLKARLLVVDPIVSAVAGDSHKNAEVRRALQPIVELGQRLGCAVLGITHFTKGTAGRDPVERITGSLAFAALARMVLIAAKVRPEPGGDEEPPRMFIRAKSNVGPDDGGFNYSLELANVAKGVEGQRARWLSALEGTAQELLADAEADRATDAEDSSALGDATKFLQEVLTEITPAKEVRKQAAEAGVSWATVRRAADAMGVKKQKGKGKGKDSAWYWSMPQRAQRAQRAQKAQGAQGAHLGGDRHVAEHLATNQPAHEGVHTLKSEHLEHVELLGKVPAEEVIAVEVDRNPAEHSLDDEEVLL